MKAKPNKAPYLLSVVFYDDIQVNKSTINDDLFR